MRNADLTKIVNSDKLLLVLTNPQSDEQLQHFSNVRFINMIAFFWFMTLTKKSPRSVI